MPSINIYTKEENIPQLKLLLNELKELIAKKLSCKEIVLKSNEISIRVISPHTTSQIAELEIVIIAHSFQERVRNQDKICLEIKNFIQSKINNISSYVWLQLSELGHSSQ